MRGSREGQRARLGVIVDQLHNEIVEMAKFEGGAADVTAYQFGIPLMMRRPVL